MVKVRRSLCILTGVAGMYFLDPTSGRRRRAVARDRFRSRLASRRRQLNREAAYESASRRGEVMKRAGAGKFHRRNDPSVADHLHEVLERIEVPTNDVTVEVVDDVVRLRGQVRTTDELTRVLAAVGAESGERHVESLLHLPTEPAPNKAASRRT
jgi:hyperosmotically inducible protein